MPNAKVEVFREKNGYSVYVEKLVPEMKDEVQVIRYGKPSMILQCKLDYFRQSDGKIVRANTIRGQATASYELLPRDAALKFASTAAEELGVSIDLSLIDDKNPAEFFLEDRLKELQAERLQAEVAQNPLLQDYGPFGPHPNRKDDGRVHPNKRYVVVQEDGFQGHESP